MARHKFSKNTTRSGLLAVTPRAMALVPDVVSRGVRGLVPSVSVPLR
jgi:hypothetical protein